MNVFDKIDNYFEEKPKKEFIYTILMIVALIGFIIYYFIYPKALSYKTKQEKTYSTLTTKLSNLRVQYNVFNARIAVLSKNIKEKQNTLTSLNKKQIFYSELVKLLDFAEFDEYKWANLVHSIVKEAKNKGLRVKEVTNKIYNINLKNNSAIVKRMDIGIALEGKYENFIYYVYEYEDRKELIRVSDMNITAPGKFLIKFSVYGYNK